MQAQPQFGEPGLPGGQKFNRLWIGGLPRNIAIDDVRAEVKRIFNDFGPVADLCVITTAKDVMSFVQYSDETVAQNARETMNGKTLLGSVIKVNYAVIRGPEPPKGTQYQHKEEEKPKKDPNRLSFILTNLPSDMNNDELFDLGETASPNVAFANIWKDGDRVYGLLSYDTGRDAREARAKLNGASVEGSYRGRRLITSSLSEFNASFKKRSRSRSRDNRRRR